MSANVLFDLIVGMPVFRGGLFAEGDICGCAEEASHSSLSRSAWKAGHDRQEWKHPSRYVL